MQGWAPLPSGLDSGKALGPDSSLGVFEGMTKKERVTIKVG